jgi:hypothetical protein
MTPSVSGLSRGEMAAAAPAVLAKVARFRPRVVCFVGKGLWVQVGPLLQLRANDGGDNDDDEGDSGRLVARATESCVRPKEEEIDDSVMACPSSSVIVDPDARPVKAEPDIAGFSVTSDPAKLGTEAEGGDVSRGHLLAVQKAEETSDKTPSCSMSPRKRRGVGSLSQAFSKKALAPSAFVYGFQPFKVVHDAVVKVRIHYLGATSFCFVFVLTCRLRFVCLECERARNAVLRVSEHLRTRRKPSGALRFMYYIVTRPGVSMIFMDADADCTYAQRDDKVALFKTLRKGLERIKAGTFDTSSMQVVCLPNHQQ